MTIKCEIIVSSDVEHLQQIYAGFSLLHRRGFLELKQTIPDEFLQNKNQPDRWTDYKFFNTKVVIDGKIRVCYDLHDWNWIDEEILRESDFYFKRSYDEKFISQLKEKDKVFPLGLNYQVSNSEKDAFRLQRTALYGGKEKIKNVLKGLRIDKFLGDREESEQLKNLESYPDFKQEPKVLFMARAWDPNVIEAKKQREIVEAINETRAECVKVLRKEFGKRFFGGLAHDDYSEKHFKDALLPDGNLSNKRKYLEILKNFPVCVATTGLNNSIGWKLGEYVALSKAIISEPLHFEVPGAFIKEKNYLEFTAPEELVKSATRLFEDKDLRFAIMTNNYRYYQGFVKPDALVLNSLSVVFRRANY
jgi:hypothetical protein